MIAGGSFNNLIVRDRACSSDSNSVFEGALQTVNFIAQVSVFILVTRTYSLS